MKAIIFDLDGLLINSEIISYRLYQDLLEPYGYGFSIDDYAQNYSGKTAVGNMNSITERFHLPIDTQKGLEEIFLMEKKYLEKGVDLKTGVKELLKYLQTNHYKIVLASSSTKERALNILQFHHIENYFDDMVFGYEVKSGKPHPDIFLKACEKVQEKPENCLVLEDSEAGIQAAYSAHIPVICIPDMKKPNQKYVNMTTCIFDSLLDVIDYVRKNDD
jgi:HAD superfamily hydrolase (TIGR01509 family)